MNILYKRCYLESLEKLTQEEQKRCHLAVSRFRDTPGRPGLNFESLGKIASHNHHSIRASKELRIILGVEPNMHDPKNVVLAFAGHHDDAYDWARGQGHHTDMISDISADDDTAKVDDIERQLDQLTDVEDWQLFLFPEQKTLVDKEYFGETRILGAAGTGKTVLALHRAKWLGERYPDEKILFTTFSASLPTHFRELYMRIPGAPPNVTFLSINQLARRISEDYRSAPRSDDLFNAAWDKTIAKGSALAKLSRDYLKDEIERVIKGRGASREEYLDTDKFQRVGRQRGFKRAEREMCWQLQEAWDAHLSRANMTTFADKMIVARDKARQQKGVYRAIIVDEYQDITLVGAQFLRALVAGSPDKAVPYNGLWLLGDAAQRIYVGGWYPAWADLKFTGRSETIHTNYRNTRYIVEAASKVRGTHKTGAEKDEFIAEHKNFALGEGIRPVFINVANAQSKEITTIVCEIKRLIKDESFRHEDIGIFVSDNGSANVIFNAFSNKMRPPIPCFLLKGLKHNPPKQGVRIGTYDRGKGLEFKAVFLPRLGASVFPPPFETNEPQQDPISGLELAEPSDDEKEHRQLQLNRLYVGMTRAVRFLYLLADEEPCEELQNARDFFDWK